MFNNVGLVRMDCMKTSCHILTQNELFKVGVGVGICAVSVVICKAMKWSCQLCENRSSLVRNVVGKASFRFPDLKVIIITINHSRVPAAWQKAWQHSSTVVHS